MVTTHVTDYTQRPLRPEFDTEAIKDLVATIQEQLESSQGDEDKAGEIDTAAFYEGQVDACTMVLRMLTVQPTEERIAELEEHIAAYGRALDHTEREDPQFAVLHGRIDKLQQEIHNLKESQ